MKKKFKYSWLEKRKFSAERKRQLKSGSGRYIEAIDKIAESYWIETDVLAAADRDQMDVLSDFSKSLIVKN